MFYPCVFYGHKEAQKYTKISSSEFFVLLRAFLWLKISDLSFHYSSESKGIEIRNGIVTCDAPTLARRQRSASGHPTPKRRVGACAVLPRPSQPVRPDCVLRSS